jgi:triosephosphate isomerase
MARLPFLAANWKLHLGPADAARTAADLAARLGDVRDTTVAVFPTALSITAVLEALRGSAVAVGAQEIEVAPTGAWTGANSASLCRAAGCEFALVGHSERRQHYGETSERCNQRIKAAFAAGLLPIYCVGETLAERRAGRVDAVVSEQLATGLAGFEPDQIASLTLAYEPVWAIGTGENATPDQAQAVHAAIRAWLAGRVGAVLAAQVRIQYGGSVKPANAAEILRCPDVDGALVGGASLDPESFAAIVRAAAR